MIGTTSKDTSFAALSGTVTYQRHAECTTNNPPTKAHSRQHADPIKGFGYSHMNPATPTYQRTVTYSAPKHSMNAIHTYEQDGADITANTDDGADVAHITRTRSSSTGRNPTSGMFSAALQAGIDRASCNQMDMNGHDCD